MIVVAIVMMLMIEHTLQFKYIYVYNGTRESSELNFNH